MRIYPPDTDSHLPRHQRRYPFRPLNDVEAAQVRAEADDILLGIDNMLARIVLDMLPQDISRNGPTLDDVMQLARIRCFEALPQYDSTLDTKVSSFLFVVARNRVKDWMRGYLRKKRIYPKLKRLTFAMQLEDTQYAPSIETERLVEAFNRDSKMILTEAERTIVSMLAAGGTGNDLCNAVGISHNKISIAKCKIKQKIREYADSESFA